MLDWPLALARGGVACHMPRATYHALCAMCYVLCATCHVSKLRTKQLPLQAAKSRAGLLYLGGFCPDTCCANVVSALVWELPHLAPFHESHGLGEPHSVDPFLLDRPPGKAGPLNDELDVTLEKERSFGARPSVTTCRIDGCCGRPCDRSTVSLGRGSDNRSFRSWVADRM